MTLSLLLDVVVAALLVATIAYAAVLDRRIRQLKSARGELETMVVGFNAATARAETAIGELKAGTEGGSRELKPLVATGRQLADDLSYLIERGNELADRLDAGVSAARQSAPKGRAVPAVQPAASPREVSDAEHALLKALRSVR
ncbi:MAG TPA: DUF6468 domain-containing protein [Alphaproteobacteria bacterium]|nr:DUF6468 domain-containing protein [Alphaproteobacteria bacterium]